MKRNFVKCFLAVVSVVLGAIEMTAQVKTEGTIVYALPSTSLHLSVESIKEVYTPGPYAQYAKKYLGIEVETEACEKYHLASVKLIPNIEADMSKRYVATISGVENIGGLLLKMTSQGVVVLADQHKGEDQYWRFPTLTEDKSGEAAGATQNFTSIETTLYKNVKNSEGGYDRVAIQQSQVVEKSLEKKAQEISKEIFQLRKQRVQIITGDTDATYSGEALGAAVAEITRLEQEYMSLFLGKRESVTQKMDFDVTPKADAPRQLYVAFRVSDKQGLILADNISGRPIVLELTPEEIQDTEIYSQEIAAAKGKKGYVGSLHYRIPAVCTVKILDGQDILLQTRIPVYQLGQTVELPLSIVK